jgi:hypothetical protein
MDVSNNGERAIFTHLHVDCPELQLLVLIRQVTIEAFMLEALP